MPISDRRTHSKGNPDRSKKRVLFWRRKTRASFFEKTTFFGTRRLLFGRKIVGISTQIPHKALSSKTLFSLIVSQTNANFQITSFLLCPFGRCFQATTAVLVVAAVVFREAPAPQVFLPNPKSGCSNPLPQGFNWNNDFGQPARRR